MALETIPSTNIANATIRIKVQSQLPGFEALGVLMISISDISAFRIEITEQNMANATLDFKPFFMPSKIHQVLLKFYTANQL